MAADPDGRLVAVAAANEPGVAVYDAEDGRLRETIADDVEINAIAVGPDGLIAVAGDGRVQLYEFADDHAVLLPSLSDHRGYVRLLRFSPDGALLAVVGWRTGVDLWDPAANALVASLPTTDQVDDLAFSGPRTLLVAAGEATARWAIVDPVGRARFEFPRETPPMAPSFGPGGTLVMPLAKDQPHLWQTDQCPTRRHPWPGPDLRSAELAFLGGGPLLALHAGGIDLLPSPTPDDDGGPAASPIAHLDWPRPFFGDRPRPDGERPRPEGDRDRNREDAGPTARLLARSPDGRTAVIVRHPPGRGPFDGPGELLLWRAGTDGEGAGTLRRLPWPIAAGPPPHPGDPPARPVGVPFLPPHFYAVQRAALTADGDRLLFLDFSGLAFAWPIPDGPGPPRRAMPIGPREPAASLAIGPDGRTLALGLDDGAVLLLDGPTGATLGRLDPPAGPTEPQVTALAFAPDRPELAVGTKGGALHLWDLGDADRPEPHRLLALPGHRGLIAGLTYAPDGRQLAFVDYRIAEDRAVESWDLGRIRQQLDALGLGW